MPLRGTMDDENQSSPPNPLSRSAGEGVGGRGLPVVIFERGK